MFLLSQEPPSVGSPHRSPALQKRCAQRGPQRFRVVFLLVVLLCKVRLSGDRERTYTRTFVFASNSQEKKEKPQRSDLRGFFRIKVANPSTWNSFCANPVGGSRFVFTYQGFQDSSGLRLRCFRSPACFQRHPALSVRTLRA